MRRLLALGLGSLVSVTAFSEDLLTIFDQAVVNDPLVREAEFTRKANREARPQAWAAYLPQIGGRWTKGKQDITRSSVQPFVGPVDPLNPTTSDLALQVQNQNGTSEPDTESWDLQLSQSVFNWGQLVGLRQASKIAAQADADYGVAQQDLALRVATRYFDVLAAQDNVQAQQASLDAISRQLEQADKRFEVGLIAITDVQEARAARDTAAADLIAAKRQLATAQEFLREITDMQYAVLATPRATMPLKMPEPADAQKWVEASMEQNLSLTSSRLGADIARDDVRVAFGGHLPQVDLVVGKGHSESQATQRFDPVPDRNFPGGSADATSNQDTDKSISLQVTVPIWSSGGTNSRVRQSEYRWQAARQRLERVSRETERASRDAYLGVLSEISRVQALKQALESSATALKATEAGYDVGTRTAVDVLAARQNLVAAQTAYSRSRYDYLINVLTLKQAAGILDRKALEDVNAWLEAPPPPANPPTVDPNAQPAPAQPQQ
ncbi:MAG TPA: TolC family outer membrane protein [Steroidobacteraceae bacterium]|jgi:outer membrane protein|nr:TolC family outer membrane protein [Steroidobacteraceae bacterium]